MVGNAEKKHERRLVASNQHTVPPPQAPLTTASWTRVAAIPLREELYRNGISRSPEFEIPALIFVAILSLHFAANDRLPPVSS